VTVQNMDVKGINIIMNIIKSIQSGIVPRYRLDERSPKLGTICKIYISDNILNLLRCLPVLHPVASLTGNAS